jgi:hypothetical protein
MEYWILLVGILFGILLNVSLDCRINEYNKAIELCERELLRNQKCEVIGKLKEK